MNAYTHTQRGRLHWLLWASAVLCWAGAWFVRSQTVPAWLLLGIGMLVAVFAFCFETLTVRDAGEALDVRFGRVGLFHTRVPYDGIRAVRVARSRWIDGWGVHWVPGRGWTWNLWGFDCVELETARGRLRIGTDDARALCAFLERRLVPAGS